MRVVQEALNNVRRHSGAESVSVSLRREGEELLTEVSDDGRGLETEGTGARIRQRGMREGASALGGNLEVESEAGQGTRVRLRIPLSAAYGERCERE